MFIKTKSHLVPWIDWYVCIAKSLRILCFIFLDSFWFLHILLISVGKFLAQLPVDHLPHSVVPVLCIPFVLVWCSHLCDYLFNLYHHITCNFCSVAYYYYLLIRVFHISVNWWSFTVDWVTASLLESPGLFSVFWLFSIMLLFGWSPLGRQLPTLLLLLLLLLLLFHPLRVFHWSISDSKSPKVSRIFRVLKPT